YLLAPLETAAIESQPTQEVQVSTPTHSIEQAPVQQPLQQQAAQKVKTPIKLNPKTMIISSIVAAIAGVAISLHYIKQNESSAPKKIISKEGDELIEIAGVPVSDKDKLQSFLDGVRPSADSEVVYTFLTKDGKRIEKKVPDPRKMPKQVPKKKGP